MRQFELGQSKSAAWVKNASVLTCIGIIGDRAGESIRFGSDGVMTAGLQDELKLHEKYADPSELALLQPFRFESAPDKPSEDEIRNKIG